MRLTVRRFSGKRWICVRCLPLWGAIRRPAKKYGIQTGEPIVAARKKCPNLIIIPPDFPVYVEKSKALIALLKRYSDQVVQYSIDEAWADFTGYEMLYGDPVVFAHKLKDIIKEELKFTVNIGVSSNRLLAASRRAAVPGGKSRGG